MSNSKSIINIILCCLLSVDIGVTLISIQLQYEQINQLKPMVTIAQKRKIQLACPEWEINEKGQTYGPDLIDVKPDLIEVIGNGGRLGYVYSSALKQLDKEGMNQEAYDIPLFDSNGQDLIGTYTVYTAIS